MKYKEIEHNSMLIKSNLLWISKKIVCNHFLNNADKKHRCQIWNRQINTKLQNLIKTEKKHKFGITGYCNMYAAAGL